MVIFSSFTNQIIEENPLIAFISVIRFRLEHGLEEHAALWKQALRAHGLIGEN